MFTDLYLRFANQAEADALLFTAHEATETAEAYATPNYLNADVLGTLYEGGEWGPDGTVITPPTALAGWHVNVRLMPDEDGTALLPAAITPTNPRRVWA